MNKKTTVDYINQFIKKNASRKNEMTYLLLHSGVLDFTRKIGKEIWDFSEDECIDMFMTLRHKRQNGKMKLSARRLLDCLNYLTKIVDEYFEEQFQKKGKSAVKPNPFSAINKDKLWERYLQSDEDEEKLTIENIYSKIDEVFVNQKNMSLYLKTLIGLRYNGVSFVEMVSLKKENIFPKKSEKGQNELRLGPEKDIIKIIDDTTMKNLLSLENVRQIGHDSRAVTVRWRDHYLPIIIYKRSLETFQDSNLDDVQQRLINFYNRQMKKADINVKAVVLARLGLFDRLVEKYGEEITKEMIYKPESFWDKYLGYEANLMNVGYNRLKEVKISLKEVAHDL